MMRYSEPNNGSGYTLVRNCTEENITIMDIKGQGDGTNEKWSCPDFVISYPDFTQISSVYITIIIIYVVVIILTLFGNLLVIWTIWRNIHMQTVTNYYIVNLALSDLLVSLFCIPLKLMEYTTPCQWGIFSSDILCAILYYVLPIFVFTSIFTLVAISLERYYAIVHPLSAMKVNSKSRTKKIIAATWIIPFFVCMPYLYCNSQSITIGSEYGTISRQYCTDRFNEIDGNKGTFRKCYFILLFVLLYFLPMTVIIATCAKITKCLIQPIIIEQPSNSNRDNKRRHEISKRKVARMVIVVALAFILAWSPLFLVNLITQIQKESFLFKGNFFFTMLVIHLFGFINSCLNPLIYTAMSEKFRKSFKRTLRRLFCHLYPCRSISRSRSSFFSRRPTALTCATRTFIDAEEEPLHQQHSYEKKHGSNSDNDSSGSSKHSQRVRYIVEPRRLSIESDTVKDSVKDKALHMENKDMNINAFDIRSDSDYESADKGHSGVNSHSHIKRSDVINNLHVSDDRDHTESESIELHPRVHFSFDDIEKLDKL